MATYIGIDSLVEARASAVLPASPAWDASPTEFFVSGVDDMSVNVTYTQGAAGGSCEFQIELSPYSVAALVPAGANEWMQQGIYEAAAVAGGALTQSLLQNESVTFDPVGAAAEGAPYAPIRLGGGYERCRIRAREAGVPGTPGTAQIQVTLNGYQPAGMR
jgi:hypothetical protein